MNFRSEAIRDLLGPLAAVALGLLAASCNGGSTDEGTTASAEDRQVCDDAEELVYGSCFLPNEVHVIESSDRLAVTDISTLAITLEGGIYLPRQEEGDLEENVGFVLADNEVCQVSCVIPCDVSAQSLCMTSLASVADGDPSGCMFCGEVTEEECQEFLAACGS